MILLLMTNNISKIQVHSAIKILIFGALASSYNSIINFFSKDEKNEFAKFNLALCFAKANMILADSLIKDFSQSVCDEFNITSGTLGETKDFVTNLIGAY